MTLTRRVVPVSLPAAGDLSANQFRIVFVDDLGRVDINTGVSTPCFGVLTNKPAALGRGAEIAAPGSIVKLEAGAAVNERDAIRAVAGGRGSPTTTTGDYIIGRAITPASGSGSLFEVQVDPDRFSGTSA